MLAGNDKYDNNNKNNKYIYSNLPERVIAPPLVSIDEELFPGSTWPELMWKF